MSDLADLKRRVEEATGPDRELDAALHDFFTPTVIRVCPKFTASLDATVALIERVMPGAMWTVSSSPTGSSARVWLSPLVMVQPVSGDGLHRDPRLALLDALLSACEQGGAK